MLFDRNETNSFVTDAPLPEGRELAEKWLVLEHGDGETTNGHEIDRVERKGGASVIHLKRDHGMTFADGLATEALDTKSFGVAVTSVLTGSLSLFMCHGVKSSMFS